MSLSLSPTVALAEESDVTEPLAEETAADGPALSDEARPPEDAATGEVLDDGDEENVLDGPALFKDARPSEELTEEEAPAAPEGGAAPEAGADTEAVPPADGGEADASQPEIAPISIDPGDTNAEKVKNYFANGGLASTYVTKRHTDGQSDTAWSIVDRRGRRRISLLRRRGRRRHGDL